MLLARLGTVPRVPLSAMSMMLAAMHHAPARACTHYELLARTPEVLVLWTMHAGMQERPCGTFACVPRCHSHVLCRDLHGCKVLSHAREGLAGGCKHCSGSRTATLSPRTHLQRSSSNAPLSVPLAHLQSLADWRRFFMALSLPRSCCRRWPRCPAAQGLARCSPHAIKSTPAPCSWRCHSQKLSPAPACNRQLATACAATSSHGTK